MITIDQDTLNLANLKLIHRSGNEGYIYRDNKYCYKFIYPKFRKKSQEIIKLISNENIKDLIEVKGIIEQKGEYVGFITNYLKGYGNVLPASKNLILPNRIKLVRRIGRFGKQFEDKFYIYDDFGVHNIMIKPTRDGTNYSDMVVLDPEAINIIDEQGLPDYVSPLYDEVMSGYCRPEDFDMTAAFNAAFTASSKDFENLGLDLEDFDTYELTLDEDDELYNGEYKDMSSFYRSIAITSLSILTQYNWENEIAKKDVKTVLDKIKRKYNDPHLNDFLRSVYFSDNNLEEMYFHENMKNFDIEKISKLK